MKSTGATAQEPRRERLGRRLLGWLPDRWRGLVTVAVLLLTFAVLTLLVAGPLRSVDVALNHPRHLDDARPFLTVLDRIGQRAVCLPILALVAVVTAYQARLWRPLVLAGGGVLGVNLFVAFFKFSLERGAPLQGRPDFLVGGEMYPSGHSANVVLVYGLAAYLWWRYHQTSRRVHTVLVSVVVVLTLVMVATSLTLRWHWFTDLVAGVLVGAAALKTATTLDRAVPFTPPSERQTEVRPSDRHLQTIPPSTGLR